MKLSGYTVNPKHRTQKAKPDCTQWLVTEWVELSLFVEAKNNEWICTKNCVWSIDGYSDSWTVLGTTGNETAYMAKYVVDNNGLWHGYPICPARDADRPPTSVLDDWKSRGIINKAKQRKINQGRW
ncbi:MULTISPECIES: hypothetical protein [Vibrio]|uniref:hypothetical protein n=1 Tax=Vibrio TaxID=662 RepID=UPI000D3E454A|nr:MULTISPECIES: hypothetical protein [Vibrio]EHZ7344810.1 hypothetical protein [Vibrio vulnificus]MBN8142974.1 hypothetical protein [Vibrio vulnificus]MBN8152242.1 hypothetical protein [Vibrio vulnificus]MBT0082603.1 hypothetical protein [Vibrio alginolyticus]MBT0105844.1 hypothetical protein [Vibrio alginolyticus]